MFLSTVAGFSSFIGFGNALAAAKKRDPKYFNEGTIKGVQESGTSLAIRALGWGSLWAFTGCGILFYGIWKMSGATNAQEFRTKMGSILPRIPKNDPPQSRTEFAGLTDLLTYISEDWGKKKVFLVKDSNFEFCRKEYFLTKSRSFLGVMKFDSILLDII